MTKLFALILDAEGYAGPESFLVGVFDSKDKAEACREKLCQIKPVPSQEEMRAMYDKARDNWNASYGDQERTQEYAGFDVWKEYQSFGQAIYFPGDFRIDETTLNQGWEPC